MLYFYRLVYRKVYVYAIIFLTKIYILLNEMLRTHLFINHK